MDDRPTTPPPPLAHPKYRPDIDGLRALAVLLVIIFHAFPRFIHGGFIGVDIFFVISGYLISSIIFSSLDSNSFSFRTFYARRLRRIFPALLLVLLVTGAVGWYLLLPNEFRQLGKHLAAGAASLANFSLWHDAGYFDNAANSKPLLHLWSLGIEEQFYIVWPALLWLGGRWRCKPLWIITTVALASFALNIFYITHDMTGAFYSPVTRIWELLVGSALAAITLYRPHWCDRHRNHQAAGGLLFIIIAGVVVTKQSLFPGWWAVLPTGGAFLIISAGPMAWLNRHILSNRVMVWIGLISFPLYLWHWPLLSYAHILRRHVPIWMLLSCLGLSFIFAWLTHVIVEKNLRFRSGRAVVVGLTAAMLGIGIAGVMGWQNIITPRQDDPQIEAVMQAVGDWNYPPAGFQPFDYQQQRFYQAGGGSSTTLFIGDSHIEQYAPRVAAVLARGAAAANTVIFATYGGCPPIPRVVNVKKAACVDLRNAAITLAHSDVIDTIVIGAHWDAYFHPADAHDYYYDDKGRHVYLDDKAAAKLLQASLSDFLHDLARHKQVFLLLDNVSTPLMNPLGYFTGQRWGRLHYQPAQTAVAVADATNFNATRAIIMDTGRRAGVTIIDPVEFLCPAAQCPTVTADGLPLYKDDDHLRPFYVRSHAGFIDQTFLTSTPHQGLQHD